MPPWANRITHVIAAISILTMFSIFSTLEPPIELISDYNILIIKLVTVCKIPTFVFVGGMIVKRTNTGEVIKQARLRMGLTQAAVSKKPLRSLRYK